MTIRSAPNSKSMRFGGLVIAYSDEVLEPRPWTLLQSEWAAELAAVVAPGPILEVCSGAGHIGLVAAIASGRPIVQVDADPVACEFARRNAEVAGIADRVRVVCSPIEDFGEDEYYPLILADPPYIRSADVGRFPDDPVVAIDGGGDGFALVEQCLGLFVRHLSPDGKALLQLGRLDGSEATFDRFGDSVRPAELRSAAEDRNVVLFERRSPDRGQG